MSGLAESSFKMNYRFKRQFLSFNGKSSKDFLLYLSGPGIYNSPSPDISTFTVPGMNGNLVQNNARSGMRRFNNVDIKYKAFFFDGLPAKTAAVKSWLLSPTGYCKLQDTYDPDFFRMGICTNALSFDVTRQKVAEMELTFNCKPQRWSVEGQKPITLTPNEDTEILSMTRSTDGYFTSDGSFSGSTSGLIGYSNYISTIGYSTLYVSSMPCYSFSMANLDIPLYLFFDSQKNFVSCGVLPEKAAIYSRYEIDIPDGVSYVVFQGELSQVYQSTITVTADAVDPTTFTIRNPYAFPAWPLIRVYGEYPLTLRMWSEDSTDYGVFVIAHGDGSDDAYTELDFETQNAVDENGDFINDAVSFSGSVEDLPALWPGNNYIYVSSAVTKVELVPRWWTL